MRGVTIQCLFYGSLIFGIWTALLYIYIYHNHVSNLEKKTQGPALIWSLGKKLQQQSTWDPKKIPRPRVRFETPDEYEAAEYKTFSRSGMDTNYSNPEYTAGFLKYGFNAILSKSLGSERDVPDTRNKMCLQKHYSANLPTASVVICFHNEEFNALFWTMSSVINLTPRYLLEEIVLVDDMSDFDDLKEKLDHHLEIFRGKIKFIRNKKREGLIRSRLIGASRASDRTADFCWCCRYICVHPEAPLGLIWMCGGQLFILPCSRVGHINKPHFPNRPGFIKAKTYNNLRLVHVWVDEYKVKKAPLIRKDKREQFFLRQPGLKSVAYGNISERVELRKRLGCEPFQWYLDNVFPELETFKDRQ